MDADNKDLLLLQTRFAGCVDLLNPEASMIDIQDIASALSKICRFGGHCRKFYSVAEHSWLTFSIAFRHGQRSPQVLKAVLLHDAAEAYIGDVVTPLKRKLPLVAEIEAKLIKAIGERFSIDFDKCKEEIKRYDNAMIKAELSYEFPWNLSMFSSLSDVVVSKIPELQFMNHEEAKEVFLREASWLGLLD